MSGIYIHIPFCKQACHYCNFHFSTSLRYKDKMVDAIIKEIHLRKNYLSNQNLKSIYLGGGTPSLLSKGDIQRIFEALSQHFSWDSGAEITLEANPDDLKTQNLIDLKDVGINRLSIGIQSFYEEDLLYMNRAHNAEEAERCIQNAQDVGFHNISADLIYGSPTTTQEIWESNIEKMVSFDIPHISAYCLTVEEGTALHHFVKTGKSKPVDEERATRQFETLIEALGENGYDHYEISNFGKPDAYAVHNTNYWLGKPYLGIGPAAHSFDGMSTRSWNIAHNPKYISSIDSGILPLQSESLSISDRFNEFLLIRLRTIWGVDESELKQSFPDFSKHFYHEIKGHITSGHVIHKENRFLLTERGKHLADRIAMELFVD